jgi:polysaccharide biosynthesis protein PelG
VAGIGFVLERVIDRQGLRGLAGAAATGVLIVAGPWLISSVALFAVSRVALQDAQRFFAIVVYCYAFTLLLFGGYHYRFTRRLADALYHRDVLLVQREYRRALASSVIWGLPPAVAVAILSGLRGVALLAPVALFLAVNTGWIHTLFASLLQRFRAVLLSYLGGALVAIGAAVGFSRLNGAAEGAGINAAPAIALFAMVLLAVGAGLWWSVRVTLRRRLVAAERLAITRRGVPPSLHTLRRLALIGWGLAAILWLDKMVAWVLLGAAAEGTFLWLYPRYDQTVFVAQLFMIPPTVVFVVRVETAYFRGLRAVLKSLRLGTGAELVRVHRELESRYSDALAGQLTVQLLMVVLLSLVAPEIVAAGWSDSVPLLIVTGVAAQLYFLFYSLLVNLLYLSDYRAAVRVILATVLAALVLSVAIILRFGAAGVGYPFLGASVVGVLAAGWAQHRGLRDFDWLVLTRVNA